MKGAVILLALLISAIAMLGTAVAAPTGQEPGQPQRGFFGRVTNVQVAPGASVVTLETNDGTSVDILVNDETKIRVPARNTASIVDITPNSFLAVHAVQVEDGFLALSVLVKPERAVVYKHLVGTVDVADGQLTITDQEGNKIILQRPQGLEGVTPGQVIAVVVQIGLRNQVLDGKKLEKSDQGQPGPQPGPSLTSLKVLAIEGPTQVEPGATASFKVFQRGTREPVEGAQVYALEAKFHSSLRADAGEASLAASVRENGQFLGTTDSNGMVAGAFDEEGAYLIVALKDQYLPGFLKLTVRHSKGLEIKAPDRAKVGEEVTMLVLDRENGDVVPGAEVYAIAIKTLTAASNVLPEEDLKAVALREGTLLGTTDENGELTYAFQEAGAYLLVATKDGYAPGRHHLFVLAGQGLGIRAPREADVNEPVTFHVFDRATEEPVAGAAVYAFPAHISTADIPQADEPANDVVARLDGRLLGRTDDNGNLTHSFEQQGTYLILAAKAGYTPAWSKLEVGRRSALGISGPDRAEVGQTVTFKVFDQANGQPVAGAAVYDLGGILPVAGVTVNIDVDDPKLPAVQSALQRLGQFLGETGEDGTLALAFQRPGLHYIVAMKQGYRPGATKIQVVGEAPNGLSIVGPDQVRAGQPASFKVFDRNTEQPVAGAGVFAFPPNIREVDLAFDDEPSPELVAKWRGIFLGRTNDQGEVTHAFDQPGAYIIVAIKKGYTPGYTKLVVVHRAALGIEGPGEIEVGQTATFKVFERYNREPVANAAVFMIPNILERAITELQEDSGPEILTRLNATLIGRTDENGTLTHAFQTAGRYTLVAVKRGYIPGMTRLLVSQSYQGALAIKGPERVEVGQEATFKVFDRNTEQPVAGAGVFAFPPDIREADIPQDEEPDGGALTQLRGIFLGRTNDQGEVTHAFDQPGAYIIVAVKRSYRPGMTKLLVTPRIPSGLSIENPSGVRVGQETTFAVSDRKTGQPVPSAVLFAFSRALPVDVTLDGVEVDPEVAANWGGIILGRTNESGKLVYTFQQEGGYLILGAKRGYVPGLSKIYVEPKPTQALAISGPEVSKAGQPVTFKVYQANTTLTSTPLATTLVQEPVAGAAVYAFPSHMPVVISQVGEEPSPVISVWAGIFLGRTNEQGELTHTFQVSGRFLIVATKAGYRPGATKLAVEGENTTGALSIKAPEEAGVGDKVTFVVYNQSSTDASSSLVAGAALYAFPSHVDVIASELGEEPNTDLLLKWEGTFLGRTNDLGELTYAFQRAGTYVIVAAKRGYTPASMKIQVEGPSTILALGISGPGEAKVGQDVTLRVFETHNGDAVSGASLYAFHADMDISVSELREEPNAELLEKWQGMYLGRTNDAGQLTTAFKEDGKYIIVAVKSGYVPGQTNIAVAAVDGNLEADNITAGDAISSNLH